MARLTFAQLFRAALDSHEGTTTGQMRAIKYAILALAVAVKTQDEVDV